MSHILEDLLPDDDKGWTRLVGHRRYRYSGSRGDDPAWAVTFLAGVGVQLLDGDVRGMELSALRFDAFFISHLHTSRLGVRWTRSRKTSHTRYLFLLVNTGTVALEGDARRWVAPGGGLLIVFPGDEAVDFELSDGADVILFTFDQTEISPLTLSPANVADVPPSSAVFRAAYAYLRAAADHPDATGQAQEATEILRALTREVARAVTSAAAADDPVTATFHRAQRMIDRHSTDPDFDADALATLCATSRRTLSRVYAQQGLQVAQEIRRSRARRAMHILAVDRGASPLRIALASGFRSVVSMNRALTAQYGMTASTARRSSTGLVDPTPDRRGR